MNGRMAGCVAGMCALMLASAAFAKTEQEYQDEIRTLQKRNMQLEDSLESQSGELKQAASQVKLLQDQIKQMSKEGENQAKEAQETRAAMKQVKSQLQTLLEQQANPENQKRTKELEDQVVKLQRQMQKLEDDKKAKEKENAKLQDELSSARASKQSAADLKKIQQNAAALQEQLASRQQEFAAQKETLQQELDGVKAELEQQKKLYKTNLTALQEKEQEIEALRAKKAAPPQQPTPDPRMAELETALRDANAQLLKVSQEKIEAETRVSKQGASESLKDRRVAELEQEITRLQEMLTTAQAQAAQREKSGKEVDVRVSDLESQLAEANAMITRLSDEKTRMETLVKNQQSLQQDDVSKKAAEIARLEGELRKAAEYINARNAELLSLKQENAALLSKMKNTEASEASLQAKLSDHSSSLQEQTFAAQELQSRMAELQAKFDQRDRQAAELEQERDALKADVEAARARNAEFQGEIVALEQKMLRQGSVPEEAKQRIQELTLDLQDAKAQLEKLHRLESENPALAREVASLKAEVAILQGAKGEAETMRPELRELKIAFEQARREADESAAKADKFQQTLAEKDATYRRQQQEYDDISARNKELENQYLQGREEVALKEKLLQQALLDKTLLEKVVDDKDLNSAQELKAKLEAAEAKNAELRQQMDAQQVELGRLKLEQSRKAAAPDASKEASLRLATLEQAVLEERTKRQQAETELQTARQQLVEANTQRAEQQKAVMQATAVSRVPAELFPQELLKSSAGTTFRLLGWSKDKRKAAYAETTKQAERLWIFDMQTRQPNKITEWPLGKGATTQLDWAFDNEHFLLGVGNPGQYTLYLGDSARLLGAPIQLFEPQLAFAWSPNQLQFAYFSGLQLMIQSPKGTTLPVQVGASGTSLAWSPDGKTIAFSAKADASADIFAIALAESAPLLQTLVASSSNDAQPSWSPDGRYLAFFVQADNYDTKIAVTPVDKSRAPFIVAHKVSLPAHGGPQWASTTQLMYIGEEDLSASRNSMYQVDITTGQRSSVPLTLAVAN